MSSASNDTSAISDCEADRVSTGITGLDDILGGGLDADRLYLIEGKPGTGKTTLALQFLLEGTRRGEKSLYVTLSESETELRLVAARLSLIVAIPADALAKAADSQAVALAGTMLAQIFTLSLLALTGTLMYFSLRVRSGEAPPDGVTAEARAEAPGGFAPPRAGGG